MKRNSKYRKKHCLEAPNTKDRKDTRCNFDGIIMDKPTNFIPLIEVDDYLKACISLSILGTDNQLELKEKSDFQRALLRRRHHRVVDELSEIMKGREIQIKAALKETPAFDAFCLRWAVQALGRIREMFENIAYVMAKHADPSIPDTPEEWLDGFNTFSIYQVLPQIIELWGLNTRTEVQAKKNFAQLTGK